MTRKRPAASVSGFEEVEPGEGGGPPMGVEGGVDTAQSAGVPFNQDYEPGPGDAGSTSGAGSLQLEVEILSATAIDRIAGEIARRTALKASAARIRSVTIASPGVVAFLRLHSALEAEIAALEAIAERLAEATMQEVEMADVGDTTALALPAVGVATEGARQALGSAAAALRTFAATTSYSGRSKVARQSLLDAALAKHLSQHGLEVEVPERGLPSDEPRGLFARMRRLQARCRQLQENGQDMGSSGSILGAIDSLTSLLFGPSEEPRGQVPLAQQLMLADGIARGTGKGKAVLLGEIAFSGGSYRTRKWIFNFLLGKDGLTYNGGAGVTFFLFRADDRSTLDSDTIYFALPHGRFRHEPTGLFPATNIEG